MPQTPEDFVKITGASQDLRLIVAGYAGVAVQITGTWAATFEFEGSVDGHTFIGVQLVKASSGAIDTSTTTSGLWQGAVHGLRVFRVSCSAYTSGVANVSIKAALDAGGSGGGGGGGGIVTANQGDAGSEAWPVEFLDPQHVIVDNPGGGANFGDPFPSTGVAAGYEDSDGNMAPVVLDASGHLPVQLPPNAAEEAGGNLETTAVQTTAAAAVLGTTTDSTVQGNNTGTINARLRGISVIWNDVWDSVNHRINVFIQNSTLAVTQSGTWNIATVTLVTAVTSITNAVTVAQGTFANLKATITGNGTAGTADTGVVTIQGIAAMTPILVTPAANSAVNLAQVNGHTTLEGGTNGSQSVGGQLAHDAAAVAVFPALVGGFASAAAPSDVSADGDATKAWFLRNGAQASVLTAAGALIGGDAANGLDIDVTRMSALVAGSAVIGKVGVDQTTPGTTNNVNVDTATGAGATIGTAADAAVAAGAAGTLSAKLRSISRDLVANIVLAAGGNIIGKVGIDQTTPGTTDSVSVATAQGAGATIGVTTGTAVITDAAGTVQQYLRGIIKLAITAGGWLVTISTGKTLKTVSGSFTADTDVIAAVTSKRLKIYALSVFTFGTSATTITWKSNGTSGTELWRTTVQALASTRDGANIATSVPSWLFATVAGEKLTADTNTSDTISYSLSYWDDDAT